MSHRNTNASNSRVWVVGSINRDVVARVVCLPVPGETVIATEVFETLGGKGANQAVASARAGASTTFVCSLGNDSAATHLAEQLRIVGVDVRATTTDVVPTGSAYVSVDDAGENSIVVHSGANSRLSPFHVGEALLAAADSPALVLAQGEIPPRSIDTAADVAARLGARFVLNLAPVVDVATETLAAADPLIVNEVEARELGARLDMDLPTGDSLDDVLAVASRFADSVCASVVITLGARGAAIADSSSSWHQEAFEADVVDTTGAGDSFAGVLCAALANGLSLAESALRGGAAASISVESTGASVSYGTSEQILSRLASRTTT